MTSFWRKAILVVASVISVRAAVAADTMPDLDYMAQLMAQARQERRTYPDLTRLNPALNDEMLYRVQQRFIAQLLRDGLHIGGYKGGLFPAAPLGGVLFSEGMRTPPAAIDAAAYVSLLVEAEIGFEFCAAVSAPLTDIAALKRVVCKLHPAVELPDAALDDLASAKADPPRLRRMLIPNNVATKQVLVGTAVDAAKIDLARLAVTTTYGDTMLGRRDLSVARDLWSDVRWLVNDYVLKQGYAVEPGHIIIPGSLTGIHPGKPGHYRVDYAELGVLEFEVAGAQSNK